MGKICDEEKLEKQTVYPEKNASKFFANKL